MTPGSVRGPGCPQPPTLLGLGQHRGLCRLRYTQHHPGGFAAPSSTACLAIQHRDEATAWSLHPSLGDLGGSPPRGQNPGGCRPPKPGGSPGLGPAPEPQQGVEKPGADGTRRLNPGRPRHPQVLLCWGILLPPHAPHRRAGVGRRLGGTADPGWPRGRCSPLGIALPAQTGGAFPTQPSVGPWLGIAPLGCWPRPSGFGALFPFSNYPVFVSSQAFPSFLASELPILLHPSREERAARGGSAAGWGQPAWAQQGGTWAGFGQDLGSASRGSSLISKALSSAAVG